MEESVRIWAKRAREAESMGNKVFFSVLCCQEGHLTPKGTNCPTHGRQRFKIDEMLTAHGLDEAKPLFNWGTGRGNEA